MKKTEILPVAFVLSLFVALFWAKILFTDHTLFFRDTFLQFFPWQEFAKKSLFNGAVPLWNPFSMCGEPFLANLQSAVFYPLKVFFYCLPFAEALKLFIFSNTLLGGLFMFFFVKSFKLSDEAAGLASIVFMFNGYLVNRAEFLSVFAASVWLPLIALAFKRFNESYKLGWLVVLAAAVSMPVFAGGAYIWLYNFLFLTAFLVFYLITERKNRLKRAAYFCLAILASLALSSVQLLPFLEYLFNSSRGEGLNSSVSAVASLPVKHLLEFFIADLFGNPTKTIYPVDGIMTHYWALAFYCGIIPAVLAFVFAVRKKIPVTIFLVCIMGFAVFFSLGAFNPIYNELVKLIPQLNLFRYPGTLMYLTVFSVAALSSFGFENIIKQADAAKKGKSENVSLVFLGLAVALVMVLMYLQFTGSISDPLRLALVKKALFLSIGLSVGFMTFYILYWGKMVSKDMAVLVFLLLVFIDLFVYGLNTNPTSGNNVYYVGSDTARVVNTFGGRKFRILVDPQTHLAFSRRFQEDIVLEAPAERQKSVSEAKRLLFQNYNIAEAIECANSYDPMAPKEQEKLFLTMINSLGKNKLLDLYNVKYIISCMQIKAPELSLINENKGVWIYQNMTCMPRAFFLAELPGNIYAPIKGISGLPSKAVIKEYKNSEVVLDTETSQGGWLVLTDTYYPGWKAFEDGKSVEIERAFKAFRAVKLSPGAHEVRFIYDPVIFKIGTWVTLIFLMTGTFTGVFFWKRKI